MAYSKTTWTNGVTPINETNLNKIENELKTLEQDNIIVSSTEPVSDKRKVWIQKGKNLIKGMINGYELYSTTGNTGNNTDWCVTDFIEIVGGQNYAVSGLSSNAKWWYASDFSFISKTIDNPTTAPANAKYLRMNSTIAGVSSPILVQGTSTGTYEAYVNKKIYIKNDNNIYEKFYDENQEFIYSNLETIVGRWIDGKPIYKKTIRVTNTALSAGDNNIAHNISNFSQCIKAELVKNGTHIFPYFNYNSNNGVLSMTSITNVDSTNITIRLMNDSWGNSNVWDITLYYLK